MSEKIGFSLKKITTEQFAIIESAFKEGEDVQFSVNAKYGINEEDKMVAVLVSPAFYQNEKAFLVLEMACHFKIVDDTWESFKNKDKTKLSIPVGFIRHLIMLTIGTARGVLHSKTENTPFNDFLMPTINVTEIVKSGVAFNLKSNA
ncbi:hypothetical protein [Haloflavibacter putidus]|uniref:Uncharacterized protein n=1 Tax=Haloflavibacter putidus TaxID=2576776 RepID=A0A507ZUK7_9FLAO|nr:hypothetical protein [Haloflavibacter putidus]TQD40291.1 hypothetical protein FKR84_03580 [Haloflavibacter putidus]